MGEQALRRRELVEPRRIDGSLPALTQVSDWPRLYVHDGFVDGERCALLARLGDHTGLRSSGAHDRTGWSVEVPVDHSAAVSEVCGALHDVLGLDPSGTASLRFRSYAPGEWHPPHPDHFEIGGAWLVATAMLCLEAGEGGETVFPIACPPLSVPPRAGRLTVWFNHVRTGPPDPLALHRAEPVRSGRKVTLTLFAYADPSTCESVRAGLRGAAS